jgi:methionyl-tRNA synthetase
MVKKYFDEEITQTQKILQESQSLIYEMKLHRFLEEIWRPLSIANKAIDEYKPWELMKNGDNEKAMALVALVANILAKVSILLCPVMPKTMKKVSNSLGFEINTNSYNLMIESNGLLDLFEVKKTDPLFPRIEEELMKSKESKTPQEKIAQNRPQEIEADNLITIDQFFTTELKIGTIMEAIEAPKSKKLLILQVDIGEDRNKQILAGIKEYYGADELVGMQVCVVANLKPAKLMGNKSEGMLLAAKDDNGLSLVIPQKTKKAGTPIR